jgi:dTMP kinase
MKAAKFISLEGGEGTGKSTQIRLLAGHLRQAGVDCVLTREPGGSPRGEEIRKLLLEGRVKKFGGFAEALLFSLARDDHLETIIRPALRKGKWVLSDRFMDSTRAYQGAGGNLDPAIISALERTVVGNTRPDLTILIDIDPEIGLKRAHERQMQAGGGGKDRFEAMNIGFHKRLRQAFLDIAAEEPERIWIVDGAKPPDVLAREIWDMVARKFELETATT